MKKWLIIGLVLCLVCVSCQSNAEKILLPMAERESRLKETPEWKAFIEAWNKYKEFRKVIPNSTTKELLEVCLEKTQGFNRLEKTGLISKSEIGAIRGYFSEKLGPRHSIAFDGPDSFKHVQVFNFQVACWQINEKLPLLEDLAEQGACIKWVTEHFVNRSRRTFVAIPRYLNNPDIKDIKPESLKCWWFKPMSMKEITRLMERAQKAFDALEEKETIKSLIDQMCTELDKLGPFNIGLDVSMHVVATARSVSKTLINIGKPAVPALIELLKTEPPDDYIGEIPYSYAYFRRNLIARITLYRIGGESIIRYMEQALEEETDKQKKANLSQALTKYRAELKSGVYDK